jgi:hypothetical protein
MEGAHPSEGRPRATCSTAMSHDRGIGPQYEGPSNRVNPTRGFRRQRLDSAGPLVATISR